MKTANVRPVVPGLKLDWSVISWMSLCHLVALLGFVSFSWHNFLLMMFINFLTGCVGITLTFHRLMTHRAYTVPKWLERILATFGTLALQGSPGEWIAHHRMHHSGSDTPKDPHNAREGFYYSHWGWLFNYDPRFDDPALLKKFARDVYSDPYYRFLDPTYMQALVQIAFGLFLLLVGGWQAVVWGIFVRLVVVYHSTWFVNSASHIWGYTNYKVDDSAKNNWWVALLTWGEGWHNNHHAYADVAPHGHKWWEFDVTYRIIQAMAFVGLAKNVKTPPRVNGLIEARPIAVGEN
jgi:fatty-acid desaturase